MRIEAAKAFDLDFLSRLSNAAPLANESMFHETLHMSREAYEILRKAAFSGDTLYINDSTDAFVSSHVRQTENLRWSKFSVAMCYLIFIVLVFEN